MAPPRVAADCELGAQRSLRAMLAGALDASFRRSIRRGRGRICWPISTCQSPAAPANGTCNPKLRARPNWARGRLCPCRERNRSETPITAPVAAARTPA